LISWWIAFIGFLPWFYSTVFSSKYVLTFVEIILDDGWGNFFCIYSLRTLNRWSLWSLVWTNSFHGLADSRRIYEVMNCVTLTCNNVSVTFILLGSTLVIAWTRIWIPNLSVQFSPRNSIWCWIVCRMVSCLIILAIPSAIQNVDKCSCY
jgi:hypothetical protein